jgi:DNA-binding NarL/FixJ family response regulator
MQRTPGNHPKISLFLVEDQSLFSSLLMEVFQEEPRFEVLGVASDATTALAAFEHCRPDIVIVDLLLPGMSGLELIEQIKVRLPGTKIVVCSAAAHDDAIAAAFALGADGFVEKTTGIAELLEVLQNTAAGVVNFTPHVSEVLRRRLQSEPGAAVFNLTFLRFLRHFAQREPARQIAQEMGCSLSGIYKMRRRIALALGARNRRDLERAAAQLGLVAQLNEPAPVENSSAASDDNGKVAV